MLYRLSPPLMLLTVLLSILISFSLGGDHFFNGECRVMENIDWAPSTWSLGAFPADTSLICCSVCAEKKGCVVAPYFEGICYLKSRDDMINGSYFKEGVSTCVPRSGGWITVKST